MCISCVGHFPEIGLNSLLQWSSLLNCQFHITVALPSGKNFTAHWRGHRVGFRVSLDVVEERKVSARNWGIVSWFPSYGQPPYCLI